MCGFYSSLELSEADSEWMTDQANDKTAPSSLGKVGGMQQEDWTNDKLVYPSSLGKAADAGQADWATDKLASSSLGEGGNALDPPHSVDGKAAAGTPAEVRLGRCSVNMLPRQSCASRVYTRAKPRRRGFVEVLAEAMPSPVANARPPKARPSWNPKKRQLRSLPHGQGVAPTVAFWMASVHLLSTGEDDDEDYQASSEPVDLDLCDKWDVPHRSIASEEEGGVHFKPVELVFS